MHDAIWQQVLLFLPPGIADCWLIDTLRENLGLDAFDLVDLIMRVERHFAIRLSDHELAELYTVQDLLTSIERHLARPLGAEPVAQLMLKNQ